MSLPELPETSSNVAELNVPISKSENGQDQLSLLLAQTFAIQKKYGETTALADYRDAGFQWMLQDYTIREIKEAFKKYLVRNNDLPAPADIINLIEGWADKEKEERIQKDLNKRKYERIKREMKNDTFVSSDEKAWYASYERGDIL